jgi:transglutaminase superfamily protein
LKPSRSSLAVAVVLALCVLAVPTAGALSGKQPSHRPAAKGLRAQLRLTQATLARATSELARIRGRIGGGMERQVSQLQRTLQQANVQLRAAQASLPTPLAVAVEQVRREVAYVKGGVPQYSRGQLISQAAMDYVAGHVSDTAYGYVAAFGGKLPHPTANTALLTQAGICTGAAVTFGTIVHHFGFPVRSVNFYYDDPPPNDTPDGHVAVEVFYDGSWHFFDPTFGLFWTDGKGRVLSIRDVRAGLGSVQKNVAAFTNVFEDAVFGNDAWFVTEPTTRIAFRATPVIHP